MLGCMLNHPVISDFLWPHRLQPARLLYHGDPPGKNTGVGCHALLQGIFPAQGLNPGLLHCRQILHHMSHQGSPKYMIKYMFCKYLLPLCGLYFHFHNDISRKAEVFKFDEIQFTFFLWLVFFAVSYFFMSKKFFASLKGINILFFLRNFICSVFNFFYGLRYELRFIF